MTNPSIPPGYTEPILINERLWQKWIWKNRELDKISARNRLRFFQVLLVLTVAVVLFQNFLK